MITKSLVRHSKYLEAIHSLIMTYLRLITGPTSDRTLLSCSSVVSNAILATEEREREREKVTKTKSQIH